MTDYEESPEEGTEEEAKKALQVYWNERLIEFETVIYPVFHARGYSKNTALMAVLMDELDDSLTIAAAAARKLR